MFEKLQPAAERRREAGRWWWCGRPFAGWRGGADYSLARPTTATAAVAAAAEFSHAFGTACLGVSVEREVVAEDRDFYLVVVRRGILWPWVGNAETAA